MKAMRDEYYSYLLKTIKPIDVCEKLGLRISYTGTKKILCPFHDDHNPSMILYDNHFHCFVCGAHGNIFDLIMKSNQCSFPEAINWIESQFLYVLNEKASLIKAIEEKKELRIKQNSGYEIAYNCFKNMDQAEKTILDKFSNKRDIKIDSLLKAEAFGVIGGKLVRTYENSLNELYQLIEKKLISKKPSKSGDTYKAEYSDTYIRNRIVFALRNENNNVVGFAGRSLDDKNDKPKYLFTKGLEKGSLVYRLNEVMDKYYRAKDKEHFELFITEGILDTIRLEQLGYNSVAILGSHITEGQIAILRNFISKVAEQTNDVQFHIFLDSDSAGLAGISRSIRNLLKDDIIKLIKVDVIVNKSSFIKDTLSVGTENEKYSGKDPDEIFKPFGKRRADNWLSGNKISIFEFLMRYFCDQDKLAFDFSDNFESHYVHSLEENQRRMILNSIKRFLSLKKWKELISFYSLVIGENCFEFNLIRQLFSFDVQEKIKKNNAFSLAMSYKEKITRALQVAKNSYLREEISLDNFTWDRIQFCADVFYPYFCDMFANKNHIQIPMNSIKSPKNQHEYRLKTLYSHEQLLMQQYILNELLRDDEDNPFYSRAIPAVRFYPEDCDRGNIVTTGVEFYEFYQNSFDTTVSFAYQINMPAINGEIVMEQGMFRNYYDCWKSFIQFIKQGIDLIPGDRIYKVKLDISKYYEKIKMADVNKSLTSQLEEALGFSEKRFECLLGSESVIKKSATDILDWVNKELFNYKYYNTANNEKKELFSEDAIEGIPQGPNLSAYIGNIVLFPLDKAVSQYVNMINSKYVDSPNQKIAIRYARYVDDMVIISDDPKHIKAIKDIILIELQKLGLELSTKTDSAAGVSRNDAYDWLTSEKGGLGISSIFDYPDDSIDDMVEDVSEFETIDRRDALKILQNLSFEFSYLDVNQIENMINTVFKTEEIRYSDIVRVSEMLLKYVIHWGRGEVYREYKRIWDQGINESNNNSMFRREGIFELSLLDGIIRIINENAKLSKNEQEKANQIKETEAILEIITKENIVILFTGKDTSKMLLLENDIAINIKILQLIDMTLKMNFDEGIDILLGQYMDFIDCKSNEFKDNVYIKRWLLSINNTLKLKDTVLSRQVVFAQFLYGNLMNEYSSLELFHWAISSLLSVKSLNEFKKINESYFHTGVTSVKIQNIGRLDRCLQIWFDSEATAIQHEDETKENLEIALRVLINIIDRSLIASIINDNSKLKSYIFNNRLTSDNQINYLPVPPGIEYPGIMAINDEESLIKRVDFNEDAEQCEDLDWKAEPSELSSEQVMMMSAPLNSNWISLEAYLKDNYSNRITIASELYKNLYRYLRNFNGSNGIVASKYHIFIDDKKEIRILSYITKKEIIRDAVAISNAWNSLKVEVVYSIGSFYWQAGQIMYDALGLGKEVLDKHNDVDDYDQEILEYAFNRLKGRPDRWSHSGRTLKSYEKSVDRILEILCGYDEIPPMDKGKYIFSSRMINSFISERMKRTRYEFRHGEEIYVMATWAKQYLNKHYEEILEFVSTLSPKEDNLSNSFILRRAALGYYQIGKRISLISDRSDEMVGITLLAQGMFANAIMCNIKMQVFEQIISLNDREKELFLNKELPLDYLGISEDDAVLLFESVNQVDDLKMIISQLFKGNNERRINKITPIGWLVIYLWLLEINAEDNYIISSRSSKQFAEELLLRILNLKNFLLMDKESTPLKSDEFPFEGLEDFISKWNNKNIDEFFNLLYELDDLVGVKIEKRSSKFFQLSKIKNEKLSMNLDGNRVDNYPIFFFVQGNIGKTGLNQEADLLNQFNLVWSETKLNDKIVGVSAISGKTANLAFGDPEEFIKKQQVNDNHTYELNLPQNSNLEEDINPTDEKIIPSLKPEDRNSTIFYDVKDRFERGSSKKAQNQFKDMLQKINKMQRSNWQKRTKKFSSLDRIALFQFDVDDSYQHPLIELCSNSEDPNEKRENIRLKQNPFEWDKDNNGSGQNLYSCAEFRRRKLLENVLQACSDFEVEILLLPEYSVRPETVKWITDYISDHNLSLSVWAGTCRLVPGYNLDKEIFKDIAHNQELYDWAAVLPIIINHEYQFGNKREVNVKESNVNIKREPPAVITNRIKKYPAIAMEEVINPRAINDETLDATIKRMYPEILFGNALDDVVELICAELFILGSPSNISSFSMANYELHRRFGGMSRKVEDQENSIIKDISSIGSRTSLYRKFIGNQDNKLADKYGRTQIMLVPAYTTRAVDYYVIAQASYLSAGLTTVFCNALGPKTIGGSCFIGNDSWDSHVLKDGSYLPDYSIYHGVAPGIYQQNSPNKDRGGLGDKEQALLICDINPDFSFKGSPNPQSIGKCLSLVAHLPIIESSTYDERTEEKYACRCSKEKRRNISDVVCLSCNNNDYSTACPSCDTAIKNIANLYQRLIGVEVSDKTSTIYDEAPHIISEALIAIGREINSIWLERRGYAYKKQSINSPQNWPPPTALDWIWVDVDSDNGDKGESNIQIPHYSQPSNPLKL